MKTDSDGNGGEAAANDGDNGDDDGDMMIPMLANDFGD